MFSGMVLPVDVRSEKANVSKILGADTWKKN
jgi:hypothetical protein